jgi:guanylate kinase
VGKDSVIGELRKELGIHRATSTTDRPPRPGEEDGVDYHFVTSDEFLRRVRDGRFAECAKVYGDLKGLERHEIEGPLSRAEDVIIRTDVQGARTWRKLLQGAISVFLLASDEETPALHISHETPLGQAKIDQIRSLLRSRLTNRDTDDDDAIATRLKEIDEEVADLPNNDYVVFNIDGQLSATVARFAEIIAKERANPAREPAGLLG